jgi:predicted ThiF/HesA family dinucleotide-utilizing enzyme
MSQAPISRSADLSRLRADGYELAIRGAYLVVTHIPYLTPAGQVAQGAIITQLVLQGDVTGRPDSHVVFWIGDAPCDRAGRQLPIQAGSCQIDLGNGPIPALTFSSKPPAGYADYYEKVSTYIKIVSSPAMAMDPSVTAKTFRAVEASEQESVFRYWDTATARAGIETINAKLAGHRLAIVGLGGTGAYVLDMIAKTRVAEIHLFDGDTLYSHNAFRAPGAATLDELRVAPKKVDWLFARYDPIRRHIFPHPDYIDENNVEQLRGMDFVFVCIDAGPAKRLLLAKLPEFGIPFIDTGMGVRDEGGILIGQVRTTTATPLKRDHLDKYISSAEPDPDEYESNIQIVELNALNAALAIVRWKKHLGFYADDEYEHHSIYAIAGNALINAESVCPD